MTAGVVTARDVSKSARGHRGHVANRALGRPLDRLEAALTERRVGGEAGAFGDELPGVALEVDLGGAGAGRARAGGTIVLALQRDAEAFLHLGLLLRSARAGEAERRRHGARDAEAGDFRGLCHVSLSRCWWCVGTVKSLHPYGDETIAARAIPISMRHRRHVRAL